MKNRNRSIIVTGSVALDEIMDFPGKFGDHFHPEKLHQINVSFVVDRLEKQMGGIATNIAYNASISTKLPVKILSAVGRDGADLLNFLHKHGVDITGMLRDNRLYTASGKVITDKTDNQIWGFYFGALTRAKDIDFSSHIGPEDLVIVSPTHAAAFLKVQRYVIGKSIPYVYDPGMALTWITDKYLEKGVAQAHFLIGNDYEIAQIERRLKKKITHFVKAGVRVIITLGEKGARYIDKDTEIVVGPYKKCKVVDPTGAGDAFRGGFFAAYAEGKNIRDCLRQGNAVASFAVEAYGTVNHRPSKTDLAKRAQSI